MEQQIFNDKRPFYIVLVLSLMTLILGDTINKQMFFILGLFSWIMIYMYYKRDHSFEFIILRMLILSIPLSFTNIFGQSYGESSLSWFNIFLLIIITTYLFKYLLIGKARFNHLSLFSIFLIGIGLLPVLVSNNKMEGFKQYINIVVLFILIIVGNSFKDKITNTEKERLKADYILSTIISGFGVVVQILFVQTLNSIIGYYALLGGYRDAYGFLFADYSFLSLYLASGAMMMYFSKERYLMSKKKWIFSISLLLLTSILTSARTGIVAFIVIIGLYSILNILSLLKRGSIKSIIIIIGNVSILIVSYLLIGRTRSAARFSDSGRNQLNQKALEIFLKNPTLGIGFGSGNYIGMLPHNLFFQSLAQGGLLYTIPLMIFLFVLIFMAYKKDKQLFMTLLCVIFGSMFIPNIFNSRFLPVITLLISISI